MKCLILLIALCLFNTVYCDTWALLVAGSNKFYNYRHQADICHAYQVLHAHGIPDDRIIVMMFDDIADNFENPTKGKIINKPDGPNVYEGVLKDYTKHTVTPENFLDILQGNKTAMKDIGSGRVIESGPDDNIFVYFSDHGAPGLIAFPGNPVLHASQLNQAIIEMHEAKKFKNMVIYIEACESGSMFENLLPNNISVYATTASNAKESSYACYWDNRLQTFIGDVYSVKWLEDSDMENLNNETIFKQFEFVKSKTNTSHVSEFGALNLSKTHFVSEFQGNTTKKSEKLSIKSDTTDALSDAVPSENVRVEILKRKLLLAKTNEKRNEIIAELNTVYKSYEVVKLLFIQLPSIIYNNDEVKITKILNERMQLRNHGCYVPVIDYMGKKCFDYSNDQVLRHLYIIVNLCEQGVTIKRIKAAVDMVCSTSQFLF